LGQDQNPILFIQCVTLCPVPIGMNTVVSAPCPQLIFKSLDVNPVPGKEETGAVNLQKVEMIGMEELNRIYQNI